MKRLTAFLKRRPVFCCLLAAAVLMTAFSGVQTSRAALTMASNNYNAQLVTDTTIHAALLENGTRISDSADPAAAQPLLGGLAAGEGRFHLGQNYSEALAVQNTGSIDEYVRVVVYKYWTDGSGNKLTGLDPDLIQIGFAAQDGQVSPLGASGDWVVDPDASATKERTVLYYRTPLAAGETSAPLMDTLRIRGDLADLVTTTETQRAQDGKTYTTITASYPYEGMTFALEVEVDCVQTHNAAAAIQSAWGAKVSVDEAGSLSLQ